MNKNQSTRGMGSTAETESVGFERRRKVVLAMDTALLLSMNSFARAGEPVKVTLTSAEAIAESFSGVGLAKVSRIVEHRQVCGPFEQVDELVALQGIGQAVVEKNRDAIFLC